MSALASIKEKMEYAHVDAIGKGNRSLWRFTGYVRTLTRGWLKLMTRNITLMVLVFLASIAAAEHRPKIYDLGSGNITGDVVRGPRKIVATKLNILRYDYKFNSTISFSQPVDLWSKLTEIANPPTPQPTPVKPAPSNTAQERLAGCPTTAGNVQDATAIQHICRAGEIEATILQRSHAIDVIAARVTSNLGILTNLTSLANCGTDTVKNAGRALTNFLLTTTGESAQTIGGISAQLQNGGGAPCGAAANPGPDSTFIRGTKAEWPDAATVASLATDTVVVQAQLDQHTTTFPVFLTEQVTAVATAQRDLQSDLTRLNGTDKAAVLSEIQHLQNASDELRSSDAVLSKSATQNAKVASSLPDLQQSGQKYNDFVAARDLLRTWKTRMETLQARWNAFTATPGNNPDPFSLSMSADCEFAFSRTKTTSITLSRVDQMPGTTGTNPETVLSVAVECSSPFTVSAGVAFSTLKEREFGIQPVATPPGSTTTTNEFVATTKSNFHPLPLGVIHARLWEPSDWFSLHGSFGLAGNIRSQGAGGSDAEFLIGPSVSFFRTMFLTPGLHLGREVSLGGGFQENNPVPANITTPPLQKAYKRAFGFAITFTKP